MTFLSLVLLIGILTVISIFMRLRPDLDSRVANPRPDVIDVMMVTTLIATIAIVIIASIS